MPISTCPICGRQFDVTQSDSPPFCSQRCRNVDLGRWLKEEYSVAREPEEDEDGESIE